jgi:hypothetical protein
MRGMRGVDFVDASHARRLPGFEGRHAEMRVLARRPSDERASRLLPLDPTSGLARRFIDRSNERPATNPGQTR